MSNKILHADLKIPTVRENYKIHRQVQRLNNNTTKKLPSTRLAEESKRLKSFKPTDLTTRFS
jgi:hypothetical protein